MKSIVVAFTGLIVCATAGGSLAQSARHIVGRRLGEQMRTDTRAGTTIDTVTLTSVGEENGPVLTVDFITMYRGIGEPTTAPSAVDVVVTQHPLNDDRPDMTLRVNGDVLPVVTRLHSRRSIVATVPFAEFVRMTNAQAVTEQAFDTELEFSPEQLRMLRSVAERWSGRRG
jgi:hypothetical protein